MQTLCPKCKSPIDTEQNFCAKCGEKIDHPNKDLSTKQCLKIYSLSFFLAPFGLFWFFKYLRSENPNLKKIGYHALLITILAISLSLYVSGKYIKAMREYSDIYSQNLDVYSQLGL